MQSACANTRVHLGLSDHVDHVPDPLARWPRAVQEKAALVAKLDQVVLSPPPFPAVGCWLCAGEQRIWAFLQVLCPLEMHVHVFECIYLCVGVRACGAFRPQLALKT